MSLLNRNIRWKLPLLSVAILAIHTFVLYTYAGRAWDISYTDGIVSTAILALAIWGVLLLINAFPTRVGIIVYALIVAAVLSMAVTYTQWWVFRLSLGKDDPQHLTWLTFSTPFRFIFNWLVCTWTATYSALQKRSDELEDKFKQHTDASILLKEAELYKLRQQLQPHFLYNSLNSISALTMIAPDKAQEMIGKLSDFLRSSVRREAQEKIQIDEELRYIEAYLSIEAIRFGDRLNVQFEKEYTDDATIPPFLLQPVLENAIKFGLYGTTGSVSINTHISLQESMLTITITNPYGPDGALPKGTGFGLEGIRRRLYLLYARADLLETKKENEVFTTILKIPQTHVQGNTDR
ncbi:MAG: sensor histidine kinase [Sphingobacteriales bacterium]|nr:MAG: sensor histidine kinase [Sphingobacteriales bacterium]